MKASDVSRLGLQAVVFDLDGTLVDSLPLHYEAYRDVLAEAGVTLTWEHFLSSVGGPARNAIPKFLGDSECALGIEEIHRLKTKRLEQLLKVRSPRRLPLADLAEALAGFVPIGLATSGSRRSQELVLASLGWEHLFDVVVCGDDVERGKPDPETYLQVTRLLGVRPDRCLAFEDHSDGIASALRAGLRVVRVSEPSEASEQVQGVSC